MKLFSLEKVRSIVEDKDSMYSIFLSIGLVLLPYLYIKMQTIIDRNIVVNVMYDKRCSNIDLGFAPEDTVFSRAAVYLKMPMTMRSQSKHDTHGELNVKTNFLKYENDINYSKQILAKLKEKDTRELYICNPSLLKRFFNYRNQILSNNTIGQGNKQILTYAYIQIDGATPDSLTQIPNDSYNISSSGTGYATTVTKGNLSQSIVETISSTNATRTIDTNCEIVRSGLSTPHWWTLADISQAYYHIYFKKGNYDDIIIAIDFVGGAKFYNLDVEPDNQSYSAIRYHNPEKIDKIMTHGLDFYVEFPEMANKQNARIFFITSLLALLIGAFVKYCINYFNDVFLWFLKKRDKDDTIADNDNEDSIGTDTINRPIVFYNVLTRNVRKHRWPISKKRRLFHSFGKKNHKRGLMRPKTMHPQ